MWENDGPAAERRNLLRKILFHFEGTIGAGLLVLLPLVITYWVVKFFFDLLDPILQDTLFLYLPIPRVPGLGVLSLLGVVYLAGWFTTHGLGRRLINHGHQAVEFIPGVRGIYGPLRSAMQLMGNTEDRPYGGVVLVEFPRQGAKSIGLITSQLGEINGEEMVAVYVPTTPVPSSGFLIVVPASDLTYTDIAVDDAMKIIISGGLLAANILGEQAAQQPAYRDLDQD